MKKAVGKGKQFWILLLVDFSVLADKFQVSGNKLIGAVYGKTLAFCSFSEKVTGNQSDLSVVARQTMFDAAGNPH